MSYRLPIPRSPARVAGLSTLAWSLSLPCGVALAASTNLTFKVEATFKETFDSNVYLQDVQPDLVTFPTAVRPHQESFVTSLTPKLGVTWLPCTAATLTASYSPDVNFFHAEPSEDFVAHRVTLGVRGDVDIVTWEQQSALTWIDGNTHGLLFGGPGGAPAIGGIPIRDRREAIVVRNSFRAIHTHGRFFFRPVASSYFHDFRIAYEPPRQFYVDRNDLNTGVDLGFRVLPHAHLVVGYRFGFQQEPPVPGGTVDYSNDYHRFLVGLEGKLTSWLKLAVLAGPDYRDFNHDTPAGFDDHHVKLFVDGVATLTPTSVDTLTVTVKQYEQPAFGAPSAYEDVTYEGVWKRKLDDQTSASALIRAYSGDWMAPVAREDWIYTAGGSINHTFSRHLVAELAYSYDWATSRIPNTGGREFTRHLGSLSLKYTF